MKRPNAVDRLTRAEAEAERLRARLMSRAPDYQRDMVPRHLTLVNFAAGLVAGVLGEVLISLGGLAGSIAGALLIITAGYAMGRYSARHEVRADVYVEPEEEDGERPRAETHPSMAEEEDAEAEEMVRLAREAAGPDAGQCEVLNQLQTMCYDAVTGGRATRSAAEALEVDVRADRLYDRCCRALGAGP